MRRYYINRKLGTGRLRDEITGEFINDPHRSELMEFLIDNHFPNRRPDRMVISWTHGYCICLYNLPAPVHDAAVAALPTMFVLPFGKRGVKLSSDGAQASAVAMFDAVGLDSTWIDANTTYNDVIERMADLLVISEWAETRIDDLVAPLSALSAEQRAKINIHLADLGQAPVGPSDTALAVSQRARSRRWFMDAD